MSVMGLVDVAGGLNLGAGNQDLTGVDFYTSASAPAGCACCNGCDCGIGIGHGPGPGQGGTCSTGGSVYTWGSTGGADPFLPLYTPGLGSITILPSCVCCPIPPLGGGPAAAGTVIAVAPLPGIAIPAVPGSGAAYSQPVNVFSTNIVGTPLISGILVRCSESGATQVSGCSNITFYQTSSGTKTYTALAGLGVECGTSSAEKAQTVTTTGTVPNVVSVGVRTTAP
jgi:hypothetical protein